MNKRPTFNRHVEKFASFPRGSSIEFHDVQSRTKRKNTNHPKVPSVNPFSSAAYPHVMNVWKYQCVLKANLSKKIVKMALPPIRKIFGNLPFSPHPYCVLVEILNSIGSTVFVEKDLHFCNNYEEELDQYSEVIPKDDRELPRLIPDSYSSMLFTTACRRLCIGKPHGFSRNMWTLDEEEVRSCQKLWMTFLLHVDVNIDGKKTKCHSSHGKYFSFGIQSARSVIKMLSILRDFDAIVDALTLYEKSHFISKGNKKDFLWIVETAFRGMQGSPGNRKYASLHSNNKSTDHSLTVLNQSSEGLRTFSGALYQTSVTLYGHEDKILIAYLHSIHCISELETVYKHLIIRETLSNEITEKFLDACARHPEQGVSQTRSMAYSVYKICVEKQPISNFSTAPIPVIEALARVTASHGLPAETFLLGLHMRVHFGQKNLRNIHLYYIWALVSSGQLNLALKKVIYLLYHRRITDMTIVWVILSECSWEQALLLYNALSKYTLYRSERLFAMVLFRCISNPALVFRLLQRRIAQDQEDATDKAHCFVKSGNDGNSYELNYRPGCLSPYVLSALYSCILNNVGIESKLFLAMSHMASAIVYNTLNIRCNHPEIKTILDAQNAFHHFECIIIPSPVFSENWLSKWLTLGSNVTASESFALMLQDSTQKLRKRCNLVLFPFETLLSIVIAQQTHSSQHSSMVSWIRALQTDTAFFDNIPLNEMPMLIEFIQTNYNCHEFDGSSCGYQLWKKKPSASHSTSLSQKRSNSLSHLEFKKTFYDFDSWKIPFLSSVDPFRVSPKDLQPVVDTRGSCKKQNKMLQLEDRSRYVPYDILTSSRPCVYAQFILSREYLRRCFSKETCDDVRSPESFYCDSTKETLHMLSEIISLYKE